MDNYNMAIISVSITLNLASLIFIFTNKLFSSYRNVKIEKPNAIGQKSKKLFNPGKAVIDLLFSVLLPLSGFAVFLTTEISSDPFNSYASQLDITFGLQIAYYIMTILILLFTKVEKKIYHVLFHHVIGVIILTGVIVLHENAILGLISLFMNADGLTRTLILITETLQGFRQTTAFKVVLSLHILFVFVFRVTFPIVLSVIPLAYNWSDLKSMQLLSQIIYGIAMVLFTIYNTWLVQRICRKTVREMRSSSRTGVTNSDFEAGISNPYHHDIEVKTKLYPGEEATETQQSTTEDESKNCANKTPMQQYSDAALKNLKILRDYRPKFKPGQIRVKRSSSLSAQRLCHVSNRGDDKSPDHIFFPGVSPISTSTLLKYEEMKKKHSKQPERHSYI